MLSLLLEFLVMQYSLISASRSLNITDSAFWLSVANRHRLGGMMICRGMLKRQHYLRVSRIFLGMFVTQERYGIAYFGILKQMVFDLTDDEFQPLMEAYKTYARHSSEEVRKVCHSG